MERVMLEDPGLGVSLLRLLNINKPYPFQGQRNTDSITSSMGAQAYRPQLSGDDNTRGLCQARFCGLLESPAGKTTFLKNVDTEKVPTGGPFCYTASRMGAAPHFRTCREGGLCRSVVSDSLYPIFPSGCEGTLGVALESLQGRRDLT